MAHSLKVEIEPPVFQWLRTSAGWSIEDVAGRLRTSVEVVEAIETGRRSATLRQLRELSKAYKRPLASFMLSEPMQEPPLPKDYRMLPDRKNMFDRKTIFAIRKSRSLQEISSELSGNIDYSTAPQVERIAISMKPDEIATRYREQFGIDETVEKKFKTSYEFFNHLRDAFEGLNVLVFQFSMPVEDARGFALTDDTPNVIVINSKDSIEARLFSLMHEFGHTLLGETAIDIPDITARSRNEIETWCNDFASAFLMPRSLAIKVFKSSDGNLTDTSFLNSLSRRYKVSKAMLLYNMLKLDFISKREYRSTLERYRPKPRPKETGDDKERKKQTGGIPVDKRCLSMVGNKFVSIVANNYDRKHITYTDALNYLSIRSKNFDRVLSRAE